MTSFFAPLLILQAAASAPPERVEAPAVATTSAATKSAELEWAGTVKFDIEPAPDEIVVRFDRPLTESAIKKFAEAAGADLSDFRWNDNSLVLRAVDGQRLVATPSGNSLRVQFFLDRSEMMPSTPAGQDDALDAAILLAQADAAAGYTGQARRKLAQLAKLHPNNVQIQRAIADAELADGSVSSAATRYRTLEVDDYLARRAIAESNGSAASEVIIRSGKGFTQKEGLAFVSSVPLQQGFTLGGGVRHVRTRFETVEGPLAEPTDINAESTIADVTAGFRFGPWSRLSVQGSTLLGSHVSGLGARFTLGSQERQLRLGLALRLPDVSTGEQARSDGHISRVAAGTTFRITPELAVQADVARNGYGLGGLGIRTRTVAPSGGVDYLVRRTSPSLALSYRFDAEYVTAAKGAGSGLEDIPLSDRENHSAQLSSNLLVGRVQFTGFGGWAKDRIGGGGGLIAGAGAAAPLGDMWRLDANGGVSSVSRPAVSGRQLFLRMSLSRYLKRR